MSAACCGRRSCSNARKDPEVHARAARGHQDRHILGVLKAPAGRRLKIFTDGELRRTASWAISTSRATVWIPSTSSRARGGAPAGVGRAKGVGAPGGAVRPKIPADEAPHEARVDFLKRHAPGDIKMTLPTANQFPAIAYKKA